MHGLTFYTTLTLQWRILIGLFNATVAYMDGSFKRILGRRVLAHTFKIRSLSVCAQLINSATFNKIYKYKKRVIFAKQTWSM